MKLVTILTFLIVSVFVISCSSQKDDDKEDNVKFEEFKKKFKERYNGTAGAMRFRRWKERKSLVDRHNRRTRNSFRLVDNHLSDLVNEFYIIFRMYYCQIEWQTNSCNGTNFKVHLLKCQMLNENVILSALQRGPVTVSISANSNFILYSSGIFDDDTCKNGTINHGVVLVGYGRANNTDYWIVAYAILGELIGAKMVTF